MQLNNDITDVVDDDMKHRIGISWRGVVVVMLTLFLNRNGVICKSTVFYRTPAPIIVYYFPYITCLLYLIFLIKHVRTSG